MSYHLETIRCPKCGKGQMVKVEHTEPFWDYTHKCEVCNYFICESEWEKVDNKI